MSRRKHWTAGQVRRLQDEHNERPSETPEYAVATLVQTTSVDNLMEHPKAHGFPANHPQTNH